MLFRCNILALVGGGARPKFPKNKVMLWDDHQLKCIGELSFRTEVKAVKLRKDKVVVVLEQRVYVYNFGDLRLIDAIDTCNNPKGLCALNTDSNQAVLATPDRVKGSIRVSLYEKSAVNSFQTHQGTLAALALNPAGTLLATASEKGTIIRIYSTSNQQQLQEMRRGSDKAEIFNIAFDKLSKWVAVSSDKQTIHIFAVNNIPIEPSNDDEDNFEETKGGDQKSTDQ